MAISHANTILDWYSNLPEDEMPPEEIWPFGEELEAHFEWVKEERERKFNPERN